MPSRIHIQINRRAICGALLIWLAVHLTQLLKPIGISLLMPNSLLLAGLVAYPVMVGWPLLKRVLTRPVRLETEESIREQRMSTLVSFEIFALSSMLVGILFYL